MSTLDRHREPIQIHQALHGYENGHRLIEASLRLAPDARKTMLLLSDMSGPSMVRGFESYLTGYPLPDPGVYVFARTWYAPEMERPGCVWTHSLLIGYPDLVRIESLVELQGLFRRPGPERDNRTYAEVLSLDPVPHGTPTVLDPDPAWEPVAAELLGALYGSPDRPVLLMTDSADRHEDLVLRVWAQQWPRLRRSFSFCTGSLAPRPLNGKPLDLQVLPAANQRVIPRDLPTAQLVGRGEVPELSDVWISVATQDLQRDVRSPLRNFLRAYGADIEPERAAFRPLVETFYAVRGVEQGTLSVSELIEAAARAFPNAREATRLKAGLLSETNPAWALLRSVPRSEVLLELLRTDHYHAFDAERIIAPFRLAFADADREGRSFLRSLLASKLNPFGERVLAASLESLSVEEVLGLARSSEPALERALSLRSDLAASPALWREPTEIQRRSFSVLVEQFAREPARWTSVLAAMLDAGSDVNATDAVTRLGAAAADAVLDRVNRGEERSQTGVPLRWERALAQHPDLVLSWLERVSEPQVPVLLLVSRLLSPHLPELHRLGVGKWLPLVRPPRSGLDPSVEIWAKAFLLSLGLHNPPGGASQLVAHSFEAVHDAAARSTLGEAWGLLERHLPAGGSWLWGDWDRCDKLRRLLVDRFIRFRWPAEHFLATVQHEETFRRVVRYCESFHDGRAWLRTLRGAVGSGVRATHSQRLLLVDKNEKKR